MIKFRCQACGQCCSKIRGRISAEDKKFLEEMGYGKMPVVQLEKVERISFPLYDWEAKRFRQWQDEVKIDARIKPLRAIMDLNSNKAIILTYFMDYDSCPFLDDKRCRIYHTKRGYICRFYPFQHTPFIDVGEDFSVRKIFGNCPGVVEIMENAPKYIKEMVKYFMDNFPDGEFLNAVQNDIITEWLNKTVIDLMRKRMIRPAMNYPYDKLMKRMNHSEKIDFTDFLVDVGYYSREEMDNIIKRFDENIDAKEKIEEFLKG